MVNNHNKIHFSPELVPHKQWVELLSADTGNFFQTPEAISFFKKTGNETFFIAIESEGNLKCLITGIIQKEKGFVKSFFTKRAIVFGGPLLRSGITSADIDTFLRILKRYLKKKAIYIEIRNLNSYSTYKDSFSKNGFQFTPHLNFHVDCSDEDTIKKNISRSKLRQINKSLKAGAKIVEATKTSEVIEFYNILINLYQTKIKTPLFPKEFFIEFLKHDIGKYLLVIWNNKVVGGIMCPILQSEVIYEFYICGEDGKIKDVYPSVLATWAAIQYANRNGIKKFDFMGAGIPTRDYGVRDFKSKFGGNLVRDGRFLYISKRIRYLIGQLGIRIIKLQK